MSVPGQQRLTDKTEPEFGRDTRRELRQWGPSTGGATRGQDGGQRGSPRGVGGEVGSLGGARVDEEEAGDGGHRDGEAPSQARDRQRSRPSRALGVPCEPGRARWCRGCTLVRRT